VSIDLFRNETGQLADYILPATSFLERADMPLGMAGYQPIPYAQYAEPIVAPRGQCRDEWWIFSNLARACQAPLGGSRLLQRWLDASADGAKWLPRALRFSPDNFYRLMGLADGILLGRLRKQPHGRLLAPYRAGTFMRAGALTKNRKIQLAPARFVSAAQQLDCAAFAADGGELRLIGKRERRSHNSWMHHAPGLSDGTNYLYMHPQDASQRGLAAGGLVEVRSRTGFVRVPLRLTLDIMPGTVALPHGWGHQSVSAPAASSETRGANTNVLFPDGPASLEALSGMAQLTGVEVRVSAVEARDERPRPVRPARSIDRVR
jgi:anaerobic selenocysteine-containing dehydrogenase